MKIRGIELINGKRSIMLMSQIVNLNDADANSVVYPNLCGVKLIGLTKLSGVSVQSVQKPS